MTKAAVKSAAKGVQSVDTAFRVLLALQAGSEASPLGEIARQANLTPSAAHNYLVSLMRTGLVTADGRGRYRLGPAAVGLGLAAMLNNDPLQTVIAAAEALHNRTGIGVVVAIWTDSGAVVVFKKDGVRRGSFDLRLGMMAPLSTGTGRIFTALLDERVTRPVVQQEIGSAVAAAFGKNGTVQKIRAELARYGFVRVVNPRLPGYLSLAAPVYDASGTPSHTITLIGPKADFDERIKGAHISDLLATVRLLSRQFGAPAKYWTQ